MSLSNISAIAAQGDATGIGIFAASATEDGLTRLRFQIGARGVTLTAKTSGEVLTGTSSFDMLIGGAGDDIIHDGTGSDVLTGGAGADTFVLRYDESADTITDFTPNEDRLDLSAWPDLRSMTQLYFTPTSRGIRIAYGDDKLILNSQNGRTITPDMLVAADLLGGSRIGQVLTIGFAGPAVTPDLPDRPMMPAYAAPPLQIEPGMELLGSYSKDTLKGGDLDDKIWGLSNNDLLIGQDGTDWLDGGSGADRLQGGNGDDTLLGGYGRDLAWTGKAGRSDADVLEGGAGNDQLFGLAGADCLMGEAGNDILTGGAGRDTFVFNAGADRITDFCVEADNLVLDDALWSGTRSAARIIYDFAIVTDSDILFDFGGGNSLTLQDIGSAAGLDHVISFI